MRPALVGALTGAALGAAGRAAIVFAHVNISGKDAVLAAAFAAAIGATIGGVAGLTCRPLAGIVIGAGLTLVLYAAILPVVVMFQALGAGTAPSLLEVLAVGVISGGVGALAGRSRRGAELRS